MELIVSLERGVCSCAELQVFFLLQWWKKVCQATRAISATWRHELSSSFSFPARQGAKGNSCHSDRNISGRCTIVCHRQKLGGTVQTWWFFHLWCASSWTTQNSDHAGDYWSNSRAISFDRADYNEPMHLNSYAMLTLNDFCELKPWTWFSSGKISGFVFGLLQVWLKEYWLLNRGIKVVSPSLQYLWCSRK